MTERTIWITGASSGIGRETAREFAKHPVRLALTARSQTELDEVSEQCDVPTMVLPGDVTDKNQMKDVVQVIENEWGCLDVALLGAGVYTEHDQLAERVRQDHAINVLGMVNCIETARPLLKQGSDPQLAGISSMAAYRPMPGIASYGSSKAAVLYMLRSLQQEWTDIHVSVICPGYVKTDMTDTKQDSQPFAISANQASQSIVDGIQKRKREIHFPKRFTYMIKFATFLPYWLHLFLMSILTGGQDNE